MTETSKDLTLLLELLRQAFVIAKRLRLGTLGYLLDLAAAEATEQARVLGRTNSPRS